ncbi:3-dehydroquinate synthase [Schnuerera sp. xch1]|uniref:3-dehydroquinate synthase n=1 Tax=Schnuerera sp. xch1 TaxID=2874283 RepID=UPI001CBEF9DB|nr:3-dehydroquinate synthase [Schnuerera sp. xch1]MBZ2173658.1 3-dehydroquinate synthase [Schnuerera sp. xch1]
MQIKIGENIIKNLRTYLRNHNVNNLYIITDDNVYRLYIDDLKKYIKDCTFTTYVICPGEESKRIKIILSIYDNLIENNANRDTMIISFGGGVVGDIAGFVASTYKRGLEYIQIPTTLLAQVDSSVGGKVGINYAGYKNIIGSFYFPKEIIIDAKYLKTLQIRQIICGLGEILKYGLIYDYNFFKFTSSNLDRIYGKDLNIFQTLIKQSVPIKEEIVSKDKYDKDLRKILNFGHTIGHSIESYYHFSRFNHGEAVILGMMYETSIARKLGLIDKEYFKEIIMVLKDIVNPIEFDNDEIENLIDIMKNDKKNVNRNIVFILPVSRGKVDIFESVDEKLIISSLKGDLFCL